MSIWFSWLIVLVIYFIFFYILCVVFLFIIESEALNSLTIPVVYFSVHYCWVLATCIWGSVFRCIFNNCYLFLMDLLFYYYKILIFVSSNNFCSKVDFIWYLFSHSSSLLIIVFMMYLFPSFYFQCTYWKSVTEFVLFYPLFHCLLFIRIMSSIYILDNYWESQIYIWYFAFIFLYHLHIFFFYFSITVTLVSKVLWYLMYWFFLFLGYLFYSYLSS